MRRGACLRPTLLDLIERWNAKRGFDPPVRIGIGVHTGDVFCGVVGDESRLEFTVLGETVNIAVAHRAGDEGGRLRAPGLPGSRHGGRRGGALVRGRMRAAAGRHAQDGADEAGGVRIITVSFRGRAAEPGIYIR